MKKYTEAEMIARARMDLSYCEILEKKGIVSFDEMGELIPGYIHLNSNTNGGILYLSNKALDIFERDLYEIINLGPAFLEEITDTKSQHTFLKKREFFLQPENKDRLYSHLQRLHYPRKKLPFQLFYTSSKLYGPDKVLSFSQPLETLAEESFITSIIESSYEFYNRNYHRYQSLTEREKEILSLVVNGKESKTIGELLKISYHTVRTHRKNICAKLETSSLSEFERYYTVFNV